MKKSQMRIKHWFIAATLLVGNAAWASSMTIPIFLTDASGQGQSVGTIKVQDERCGVLITPDLHNLPPGIHGFHIHANPSCADAGMAAGAHLDPQHTDEHNGPFEVKSHLGDLPVLIVNNDGRATLPVFAPRLTLAKFKGHALMIHAGGDNYSDQPAKLGGGGARMACGVVGEKS